MIGDIISSQESWNLMRRTGKMWDAVIKNEIKLAKWLHFSAYLLLFSTLLTNNAVLLIMLIPTGLLCLFGGFTLWLISVLREAKEKGMF